MERGPQYAWMEDRAPLPPFCAAAALFCQTDIASHAVRRVDIASSLVTTVAGSPTQSSGRADGLGTAASFYYPIGIALDAAGTFAVIVSAWRYSGCEERHKQWRAYQSHWPLFWRLMPAGRTREQPLATHGRHAALTHAIAVRHADLHSNAKCDTVTLRLRDHDSVADGIQLLLGLPAVSCL